MARLEVKVESKEDGPGLIVDADVWSSSDTVRLHGMSFELDGGSTLGHVMTRVQDELRGQYHIGPFTAEENMLVAQVRRAKVKQSELKRALEALSVPVESVVALWVDFKDDEIMAYYYYNDKPVRLEME